MIHRKQIFTEAELKCFLPLPYIQLREFCIFLNNKDATLDIKVRFDGDLCITFFNVSGLRVSDDFSYEACRLGNYIDIHEISCHQLENISWEFCEYENESLHFYCESIFVN